MRERMCAHQGKLPTFQAKMSCEVRMFSVLEVHMGLSAILQAHAYWENNSL